MRLDEPAWWYRPGDGRHVVRLLRPASALYGWAVERRYLRTRPYRSALPVVCVGNLTVGGTGKTPLTIRIAEELAAMGERPVLLTRGYGGREVGPHWVDALLDTADRVGDEALLLAAAAPTLVARDRAAGARAIESASAASVIVMDDGLQNPTLYKDLTIAVVDARRGFGNGEVLPAGPLRARLNFQLGLVDAVVINRPPGEEGDAPSEVHCWLESEFKGPVISAAPAPRGDIDWVKGRRLVAYAGIANPKRFFDLLVSLGGEIAETVALPDHHAFRDKDARHILELAERHSAVPVTTEKDWVRLKGQHGPIAELLARSRPLGISLALADDDAGRLKSLLGSVLTRSRQDQRASRS